MEPALQGVASCEELYTLHGDLDRRKAVDTLTPTLPQSSQEKNSVVPLSPHTKDPPEGLSRAAATVPATGTHSLWMPGLGQRFLHSALTHPCKHFRTRKRQAPRSSWMTPTHRVGRREAAVSFCAGVTSVAAERGNSPCWPHGCGGPCRDHRNTHRLVVHR